MLVNGEIQANRVIVIGSTGSRLGEFLKFDAIKLAENEGLDLVQVDDSDRPTCRIMDHKKFLYEQKKKIKKSHAIDTKEIRLGFQTGEDIINLRIDQARKFLSKGNKVKVSIKFVGRESSHMSLIKQRCIDFYQKLADVAELEMPPKVGGSFMSMLLAKKPGE